MIEDFYCINGMRFERKELLELCRAKLADEGVEAWEKDVYGFIIEWFDDKDFVCVSTSGSTGAPKQIQLPKSQVVKSALRSVKEFGLCKGMKVLHCLPSQFIAGKLMIVRAFVANLDLYIQKPDNNPLQFITENFEFAAMVPLQVQNSLVDTHKLGRIKKLLIGGGAVSPDLHKKLQAVDAQCYLSFGMTETITHVAIKKLNGAQPDSCFRAMAKVCFSTDKDGCLIIDDGELGLKVSCTDVVELIDEKHFRWLGRSDNVINSGGIKFFPEKIEARLSKLIDRRYFISSLPDSLLGERIVLFVEGHPQGNTEELVNKVKSACEAYEAPKQFIYIKEFVMTKTGKINRPATKALYVDGER